MQFCNRSEFVLSATFFEKKSYTTHIHAPTQQEWTLDHCLISLPCRKFLVDSGANFEADCFTDHFMVYMTIDFNSVIKKKRYQNAVRKTDYGAMYTEEDIRKSVGKRVDELLGARMEAGEIIIWEDIMSITRTVCETMIPKVARKVFSKGDWFDPNDVVLCDLLKERRRLRTLFLETKSIVANREHKAIQKLIVKREREMRDAFWQKVAEDIQEFDDKNDARSCWRILISESGHDR